MYRKNYTFASSNFGMKLSNTIIIMSKSVKDTLRQIMAQAWQMVKRNGYTMSEALKCAWRKAKLRKAMAQGIVKFYFQKVDGSIREAFGTLAKNLIPATQGESNRKRNDTVQTYYDSEKCDWRCFKVANLIRIA